MEPIEAPIGSKKTKYHLTFIRGYLRFRTYSMFANVSPMKDFSPEPFVEINSIDMVSQNIQDGDKVTVFNDRGEILLKAKITESVDPGIIDITEG
ncbi:MAG: molybdopterin dinucleotide binding domain-containing protein [Promethearchaeota archaeon]